LRWSRRRVTCVVSDSGSSAVPHKITLGIIRVLTQPLIFAVCDPPQRFCAVVVGRRRRCSGARRYSTEATMAWAESVIWMQKSWNTQEAALSSTNPLPWKKTMRGSLLGLEEDSSDRGRNKRSHVWLCGLMVMSLVRTEMGREGSEEGAVFGTALPMRRVKVPSGLGRIWRRW